jgi:hypothetical protein
MEWPAFGVRDAMLLLVALAAVYLVAMLLRLIHVGRQRHARMVPEDLSEPPRVETVSPLRRRAELEEPAEARREMPPVMSPAAAVAAYGEENAGASEPFAVSPAPTFEWEEVKDLFGDAVDVPIPAPRAPISTPAAPRASGFGEHLADHLARSDVEMEVQRMRDEMERMRVEVEELRASRRVSPQYAEAMELVQRGHSAQDVADRLGISLAEAELVQALSRGSKDF